MDHDMKYLDINSIQFNSLFRFRRSQYTKQDEHVDVNKYKYHNNQSLKHLYVLSVYSDYSWKNVNLLFFHRLVT